jgi:hypothetical protein
MFINECVSQQNVRDVQLPFPGVICLTAGNELRYAVQRARLHRTTRWARLSKPGSDGCQSSDVTSIVFKGNTVYRVTLACVRANVKSTE